MNSPRRLSERASTSPTTLERVRIRFAAVGSWQQWILLLIAFGAALVMRKFLIPDITTDFTFFMKPWFEFLKTNGFAGLGQEFANYNVPYLYLLYVGTFTGFDALHVVKIISGFFDISLAVGVGAIVFHFRRNLFVAGLFSIAMLFVPEIFLNSASWGQVDAIYTSFLVWMAFFLLTRRDILAWVFFALAFSFKLQAFFFLPWILVAFIVHRHRWRAVLIGIAAFLATYVPSLIAGRSISSLINVYVQQVQTEKELTLLSPTMYQWIPNTFYSTAAPAGICLALGIVAIFSALLLRRAPFVADQGLWLLRVGAAYAALIPFILPGMHDRYFYPAGVLAVVCALFNRRYLVPAIIFQFTAITAYSWSLWHVGPLLSLGVVAMIQLVAVSWTVWLALSVGNRREDAYFPVFRPLL